MVLLLFAKSTMELKYKYKTFSKLMQAIFFVPTITYYIPYISYYNFTKYRQLFTFLKMTRLINIYYTLPFFRI